MVEDKVSCSCGDDRVLGDNGRVCIPKVALDIDIHEDQPIQTGKQDLTGVCHLTS